MDSCVQIHSRRLSLFDVFFSFSVVLSSVGKKKKRKCPKKSYLSGGKWLLLQVFTGIKNRFKVVFMGIKNRFLNGDNVWKFYAG